MPHDQTVYKLGEVSVRRVGYGAMQLPRLADEPARARALLRRAVELGVNHVDTAQFYGGGVSNRLIAEEIHPDDGVVVVTKVGVEGDPDNPARIRAAQRPEQLRASVEQNLRALGVDRLALVNLRRMEDGGRVPVPADQVVDLDEQLAEMIAMRDEGLIGGIGLSNVSLEEVTRALPTGIACVQNAYSLVARADDDIVDLCVAEDIAWVPYFPLGGAFPGMPKVVDAPAVRVIAQELGVEPAQVGLAWLLHRAPNVLLIPGTSSITHLEENVRAVSIELDEAALTALGAVYSPR